MGNQVRIRNIGSRLVRVAGLGIGPGKEATMPADHFREWRGKSELNRLESDSNLVTAFDRPWDETPALPEPKPEEERRVRLSAAAAMLDPRDKTHFTKSGRPRADVFNRLSGLTTTAQEREDAWRSRRDK